VIRTVVAEFQFKGFSAEGEAAQLVAEANAKHRDAPDELANIFDGVIDWLRIAWTVRKKHAIRTHAQDLFRCGLRGHDRNFAVMIHEQAQNILLDAEIVRDYAEGARFPAGPCFTHLLGPRRRRQINGAGVPHVRFCAANAAGQLLSGHAGQLLRFMNQLIRGRAVGRDDAAQRADFANVPNQRARIDIPDDRNFVAIEIKLRGFRGTPTGANLRKLADH
jgi:hypothetical protein